jgi:hypothetical protein
MINIFSGTGQLEGMGAKEFAVLDGSLNLRGRRVLVAWRGEVRTVVDEHGVDLVGDAFD